MKNPPRIYRPDPTPAPTFTASPIVKEIRFKTAKNGQRRATYYCKPLNRWLPMQVVEAEWYIATGAAVEA